MDNAGCAINCTTNKYRNLINVFSFAASLFLLPFSSAQNMMTSRSYSQQSYCQIPCIYLKY